MQSQVSVATIVQVGSRDPRDRNGRVGCPQPAAIRLDDASETERPSLGRTQQRIELQMKTANFHCMRRDTIAALRGNHAVRFLFLFHARLLAGPLKDRILGVRRSCSNEAAALDIEEPPALRL